MDSLGGTGTLGKAGPWGWGAWRRPVSPATPSPVLAKVPASPSAGQLTTKGLDELMNQSAHHGACGEGTH